jgi:hypothetical protein
LFSKQKGRAYARPFQSENSLQRGLDFKTPSL